MKKLIAFFAGFILVLTMFAALFLSGLIYDTSKKATIETYFFQPNEYYAHRLGVPESPESIGADAMRDMLIERFITEYFYVIPDQADLDFRASKQSLLHRLSSATVFTEWQTKVFPILQQMVNKKQLQTVKLTSITQAPGQEDYLIIEYDLKKWEKPNDFSISPTVTHGQLYMKFIYEEGFRETSQNSSISKLLESGLDPAAVFKILITDISSYTEIGRGI